MKLNIAVLAGDGIGPEIMKQGVAVMQAIAEKLNVVKYSFKTRWTNIIWKDQYSV